MPGLSLISKLSEDFPWIDYHSRNKEGQREDSFHHKHQNVFVFGSFESVSVERIKKVMQNKKNANLITKFKEYNNIRYTFIRNLFHQYDMLDDIPPGHEIPFYRHLEILQSSYIWNIYKHLTQDFLIKTAEISFHQIQANMRDKVLQPLKNEILKIQVSHEFAHLQPKDTHNRIKDDMLDFRLVFRKERNSTETNNNQKNRNGKDKNGQNKIEYLQFSEFFNQMQQEKSYMPPVRVLFIGDDQQFNDFVKLYVEQVLQIQANLLEDEINSEDHDEFDSSANLQINNGRQSSVRRPNTQKEIGRNPSQNFMNKGNPVNVDFRTFILPPIPQNAKDI